MTDYRLAFNGPIQEAPTNALKGRIATILEKQDYNSLTVMFSSSGGNCAQGLSLYNFIRSLPVQIRMHASGVVESMAVPVFVAGHIRTSSPLSRFFFHAYDFGFEGRQFRSGIVQAMEALDRDVELSRQIIQGRCNIPAETVDSLISTSATPTYLSPQQAKDYGIVDEIVDLNPAGANQPGVAVWTVGW